MSQVNIHTRTVGQSFGTAAVVRIAGTDIQLHETDVFPFGFTVAAIAEAEQWAERRRHVVVGPQAMRFAVFRNGFRDGPLLSTRTDADQHAGDDGIVYCIDIEGYLTDGNGHRVWDGKQSSAQRA